MSGMALLAAEAFVEMFRKNLQWMYWVVFVYPPLMELDKLTRKRRVCQKREMETEKERPADNLVVSSSLVLICGMKFVCVPLNFGA